MLTATGGTISKVGTPSDHISDYYEAIGRNRSRTKSHGKKNHFAYDWHRAAKENPYYAASMKKEIRRLGEDSDEFQMAYMLKWMLERGMFITEERLEQLGDKSMKIVSFYDKDMIVGGIDVARQHDSTVCTALWVDWNHPDEFGLYNHRILDWLEIHGEDWESQYRQIVDFYARYKVMRIGVDGQGMGGPVAERLQVLMPAIEVVTLNSNPVDQSERWKHLIELIQRGLMGWPAHPQATRLIKHRRFVQQMLNVEKEYRNKYVLVASSRNDRNAHDDYIDSLAIAAYMTKEFAQETQVEISNENFFLERGRARAGSFR